MHSCDIIQLIELDLYKFNEIYHWPLSLLKFLIVPLEVIHVIQLTHMTNCIWMVDLIYDPSFIYCQISPIGSILCDDFMKKLKTLK
jgi:hypothetical protein